jgi:LmbE family N-acetylglucosaminyl deacetylase
LSDKLRVLAVGAHPDDVEILCAGTLVKYARQGHYVAIACVANGNVGHMEIQPPELAKIRENEARAAAEVIGAEFFWLDIPDLMVGHTPDLHLKIVDVLRSAKPDVVFAHSPDDYMLDHRAAGQLIFDCSFSASVPNWKTNVPYYTVVPVVFYMDTLAGINFLPTDYVDITDCIETKLEMLDCHESQVSWLRDHDNIDIMDFTRTVAKFRGLQCGVQYAEAFRKLEVWPRLSTRRLLP